MVLWGGKNMVPGTVLVLGSITLPFGNDMLPKSRGKDMLPSKSQPDSVGFFALYLRENERLRMSVLSDYSRRPPVFSSSRL